MTNTKQTQDDRTIQPFNRSTIQRVKAYAFTLAETLIVIGIIGVVAALTLPNLNHATGDKERITRIKKVFSVISEANDRAIATYGPISEWSEQCKNNFNACWEKRVGEFLKVSKSCNEDGDEEDGTYSSCESLAKGIYYDSVILQLADGATFAANGSDEDCANSYGVRDGWYYIGDLCFDEIWVDIDGPGKGKNKGGEDIFRFQVSDKLGLIPLKDDISYGSEVQHCVDNKDAYECTWWVFEFDNMDYLKTDSDGKCNDNPSIILDGVNNTSCH